MSGIGTNYFCFCKSLIIRRKQRSNPRWYEQRLEHRLNVFKKFLLFRTVSHASHFSKCLLGLDVPGVTKVWSGLVFIAISGCFILHWVVFDLAKGFNTLVDFTERLFLGILVLCLRKFSCDTSSEGLSSPMSVSYCPAVVREEVWVWASFVGLTTTYNTKKFFLKFSETWPVDLLLLSSHSVPLR